MRKRVFDGHEKVSDSIMEVLTIMRKLIPIQQKLMENVDKVTDAETKKELTNDLRELNSIIGELISGNESFIKKYWNFIEVINDNFAANNQ